MRIIPYEEYANDLSATDIELEGAMTDLDTMQWVIAAYDTLIKDIILITDPKQKIDLFNINIFYRQRIEDRKKHARNWPSALSTKEKVLCKLSMIKNLIKVTLLTPAENDSFLEHNAEIFKLAEYMTQIIEYDMQAILKEKSYSENKKWPGLQKDKANFYSTMYKKIHNNCFGKFN